MVIIIRLCSPWFADAAALADLLDVDPTVAPDRGIRPVTSCSLRTSAIGPFAPPGSKRSLPALLLRPWTGARFAVSLSFEDLPLSWPEALPGTARS